MIKVLSKFNHGQLNIFINESYHKILTNEWKLAMHKRMNKFLNQSVSWNLFQSVEDFQVRYLEFFLCPS